MKIQLASDLHLEHLQRWFPGERLISPAHEAEVLVLAGDIGTGTLAVDLFKDWPVPVLYVPGNHEFYYESFEQTRVDLRNAAHGTSVHILDNDVLDFGGVRFLGCTLWTDYRLSLNRTQRQLMEIGELSINDHRVIKMQEGVFTASHALAEHEKSRRWLTRQLDTSYEGKTVVVTHHAPHPSCAHPRYIGHPSNASFMSNLEELLPKADVWCYGHVHSSSDFEIEGCRVVGNPCGYAINKSSVDDAKYLQFENPSFQWACVIEV